MNYRGRLPGAVSRAAKAVQEVNILNSGIQHFDSLLKEKGSSQTLHATITNRSLLSDILTGTKKTEIKIHGEILSEDMDGREVLFETGTGHREKLAEADREKYEFEVPAAKGPIVDYDDRYFQKVMQIRADAAEHAILTRALQRAEENIGLIHTYFPEFRLRPDEVQHLIEYEARENPKEYPSMRDAVAEITETYKLTEDLLTKVCPEDKLGEAKKKLEEKRREEVRKALQTLVAGMGG